MNDPWPSLVVSLVIYILAGRLVMRRLNGVAREVMMTLLNLAGIYEVFFKQLNNDYHGHTGRLLLLEYIGVVVIQYVLLRAIANSKVWLGWLAFFCPIAYLVSLRYLPSWAWGDLIALVHALTRQWLEVPSAFGVSYMAFRCSRLVLEVRNGSAKMPGIWEYLGFAFFLPIMSVGPINTYANHRRGFEGAPLHMPLGRAALRVLVGWIKYAFLGGLLSQLAYTALLRNGHLHPWMHLPIAMVSYYLYLYCDFSGFCDMAIGAAALIGVPVLENFDNPLVARNMREFWNRWHITLSQWMRDIVFAPLSKSLVRIMGPANVNHAVAIAVFFVFLLIGIWHGVGLNYAVFGLLQAVGVVANHYYTIGLKQWLGRDGFKSYMENRWIHAIAVATTFCYYAASLLFFANTFPQIKEIFRVLR